MVHVTNTSNFSATVHTIKQNHVEGPLGKEISAAAHEKNTVRKADSTLDVTNLNAAKAPTELLFKTVIEGVNEVLGETQIQGEYDADIDVEPDALSQKIISLTTASYTQYVDQNQDVSVDDIAVSFINTINEGIDKGLFETREVLSGVNALDDETNNIINATHDLLAQGLQSFLDETEEQVLA